MTDDKLYTGKLSRAIKAGEMVTRAGLGRLSYLGAKGFSSDPEALKTKHEEELGRILFAGLSQLRGTALKASQILSYELDLLPEGVRKELEKGCYKVPPINRASVRKIFLNEFGRAPQDLFASFGSTAFAAASLGQVHRARLLSGDDVAIKIQYPGVHDSIESDLQVMSVILSSIRLTTNLLPKNEVVQLVMDEIKVRLKEEVDYQKEANNARWFADHLHVSGLKIPVAVSEFTTNKVITSEYLNGLHLDAWLLQEPSQSARDKVGQIIFDAFVVSVFKNGALHADPHIGNFLFMGNDEVALLDFGCVKFLGEEFAARIKRLYSALLDGNKGDIIAAYQGLYILSPDITEHEYVTYVEPLIINMQNWITAPFRQTIYDFSNLPVPQRGGISDHKNAVPFFNSIDRDQLYFDRTIFGTFSLLKKMGARVNTQSIWTI